MIVELQEEEDIIRIEEDSRHILFMVHKLNELF